MMEVFVRHLTTSLGYLMVDNHVLCQEVKLVSGNRRVQRADTRMQTADFGQFAVLPSTWGLFLM